MKIAWRYVPYSIAIYAGAYALLGWRGPVAVGVVSAGVLLTLGLE